MKTDRRRGWDRGQGERARRNAVGPGTEPGPLAARSEHGLVADKYGVNTNGPAAKVIHFDRLGKKIRPGTPLGKILVG